MGETVVARRISRIDNEYGDRLGEMMREERGFDDL